MLLNKYRNKLQNFTLLPFYSTFRNSEINSQSPILIKVVIFNVLNVL